MFCLLLSLFLGPFAFHSARQPIPTPGTAIRATRRYSCQKRGKQKESGGSEEVVKEQDEWDEDALRIRCARRIVDELV
ncbi:hypothetical protein OF83DRAFT_1110205 [Amylostereum chailletii]|nr:hypothetical protein OF83DRAFT_1110205 [Amylostereum chailletii]